MSETLRTRMYRWFFNFFPAYGGTGGRITYVDRDFREVRAETALSWRTRNYAGTIFGGSMYGAVDPVCMIMLIQRLGEGYAVWDKAASIRFKKPGRSTLHASFVLGDEGLVHAVVEKTVHVRLEERGDGAHEGGRGLREGSSA